MSKIKIDFKTKLNAIEALTKLLKEWDKVKSVIIFVSSTLRFKATRRVGQNEILITFGKLNYSEKKYFKKYSKAIGTFPKSLIIR